MPIISSTFVLGPIQKDGRRYCTERHTDHLGISYIVEYLADPLADHNAVMLERSAGLVAQLKDEEAYVAVFVGPWNYALQWINESRLLSEARKAYRQAEKERAAGVAARILEWIANGRFTDVQVQTEFGKTDIQWAALKSKMQALAGNYAAVESAVGE